MGQDLGTFIHPPTDQFFFIMHFLGSPKSHINVGQNTHHRNALS